MNITDVSAHPLISFLYFSGVSISYVTSQRPMRGGSKETVRAYYIAEQVSKEHAPYAVGQSLLPPSQH
jgi:hypothetical protein